MTPHAFGSGRRGRRLEEVRVRPLQRRRRRRGRRGAGGRRRRRRREAAHGQVARAARREGGRHLRALSGQLAHGGLQRGGGRIERRHGRSDLVMVCHTSSWYAMPRHGTTTRGGSTRVVGSTTDPLPAHADSPPDRLAPPPCCPPPCGRFVSASQRRARGRGGAVGSPSARW